MQLKTVLLAACFMIGIGAAGQTDSTLQKTKRKSCSCSFSSINQGGIMRGEAGSYFQFQTINGLRYKTWFAGLGVGVDRYPANGVPVFLDIRKYLLQGLYTPFVYADGGYHFADMNSEKTEWQSIEYTNGVFYDLGLGFRFGFNKKSGLLFSGGYSFKKYEKKQSYLPVGCNFFPCAENSQTYSYRLNRLSLKLGFQF
jgi:hypothetical protein